MKQPYLSCVIPAYNEETNIRLGALEKVARYLRARKYEWEAIIVDDGSSDSTAALVRDFVKENPGFRFLANTHQGKAATVIAGIRSARGKIVMFTDLDQATPINQLEKLLPWFERGMDVVIGSRSHQRRGAPLFRRLMARGFMILRGSILGLHGIVDTQCGFKAFTSTAAAAIIDRLNLYGRQHEVHGSMVTAGFDIEVLFIARSLRYRIKEVSVDWNYVETRRVNPIKDSIQGLLDILRIRMNAWKGYYSHA